MEYVDWVQWPAILLTAAAAWLVGSRSWRKRNLGFLIFLLSNILWVAWGWYARAYALIILQVCLAALNSAVRRKAIRKQIPARARRNYDRGLRAKQHPSPVRYAVFNRSTA